jgi:hypothetical protein
MKHAKMALVFSFLFNAVLGIVLVLTIATLVEERSKDNLRLTVHRDDLLTSVRAIQGACRCLVEAIPLNGEEDEAEYWRIHFHRTESIS